MLFTLIGISQDLTLKVMTQSLWYIIAVVLCLVLQPSIVSIYAAWLQ